MPSVWKEVLLPGRQRDRFGNWFRFSRNDVLAADRNCKKMLARGVPLPCVWEHVGVEANSPDDKKAAYAKHTFGHISDSRVNGRGALELLHDVPDPADLSQLAKTRYVSPKVYPSYSDSQGGRYDGTTIAHVAATPTPVQFWQKPFELSRGHALYLSYTPEEPPVADESEKKEGGGGEKKSEAKTGIAAVIAALKDVGFSIPDEVGDETGLVIAIKASGGPKADDDLGDLDGPAEQPPGATTPAGGTPMMMSWVGDERRDLDGRVRALFKSGRVDRPTALALRRQAKVVEMSFSDDCEANSPLHRKLADLERRPAHSAFAATGHAVSLSDARPVAGPPQLTGETPGVVEFMCKGLPGPAKK